MVEKPEPDADQVESELQIIREKLKQADQEAREGLDELVDHELDETIDALEHLIELYDRLESESTGFLPQYSASRRQTSLKVVKRDMEHIQQ